MNQSDELRSIYDRCDVSNNRTDNPMSFADFEDYINANYLPKSQVVKAIGDMHEYSLTDIEKLEYQTKTEHPMISKTKLLHSLSLDGGEV